MPLFNRTDTTPLTAEDRVNLAVVRIEAALSTFTDVVDDLEAAALESEDAATVAHGEADFHRAVAGQAEINAAKAREHADNVRRLIG